MQETEEFTLPTSGKKAIIRGYMTGFIDMEIRKVEALANKTSFDVDPEQVKAAQQSGEDPTPTVHFESNPAAKIEADKKRIELMVSAIDGTTGDILNQVLQLPKQDVDFILSRIAKVEGDSKVEGSDPKAPNA